MLNRTALILRPRPPFIDWIGRLRRGGIAADRGSEHTVYLVPEISGARDLRRVVGRMYSRLFARELEVWLLDRSMWPQDRTFELFETWFEVEYHSMVVDLCEDALVDDGIAL